MNIAKLPDKEYLNKIFKYNDGSLYWINSRKNYVRAGHKAGGHDQYGYIRIKLDGKYYQAHRIIYKMLIGEDPNVIDHINGVKDDNRIENIRSVNAGENSRNSKIPDKNMSGVIGVSWDKKQRLWTAQISNNEKKVHLGSFKDFNDAVNTRKEAEIKYGYHANHGRKDPN